MTTVHKNLMVAQETTISLEAMMVMINTLLEELVKTKFTLIQAQTDLELPTSGVTTSTTMKSQTKTFGVMPTTSIHPLPNSIYQIHGPINSFGLVMVMIPFVLVMVTHSKLFVARTAMTTSDLVNRMVPSTFTETTTMMTLHPCKIMDYTTVSNGSMVVLTMILS